jgi:hypothetical protein
MNFLVFQCMENFIKMKKLLKITLENESLHREGSLSHGLERGGWDSCIHTYSWCRNRRLYHAGRQLTEDEMRC